MYVVWPCASTPAMEADSVMVFWPKGSGSVITAGKGEDAANRPARAAPSVKILTKVKAIKASKEEEENWMKKGKSVDVKFSSLFSVSSTPSSPIPPTYLEQKRKEAQSLYLEEMAFIEKNKPEFERLIEEDKKAQASQMPDNLFGVLGAMTGASPHGGADAGGEVSGKDGKGEEVKVKVA